jgi:hypothetical protein
MSSTHATSSWRVARVALAAALFARASWAQQTPASSDAANADSLFTEAKQLMASGDYASACPKLAESYRLDPGTGTLTALAVCHQHVGKVATAWNEFVEVASSAQRQGRADREAFARQQIASLEPLLSRLTIRVPAEVALIPQLQVRRDSVVVAQPAWGVPVPVDPGDHVIEATAPDREPWTGHVTVDANSDRKEIAVPLLDPQATATPPVDETPSPSSPPPAETPPERHTPFPMRPVGLVVGGAGIVSLALGSYFGATALSKSSDAKRLCPSSPCGNESAVNENNDARSDALISDITVLAGVAAIGTGLLLFLTAPKEAAAPSEPAPAAAWRLVPTIGTNAAGLTLHAAF